MNKTQAPCSYQGGKQRLRKEIIDIIFDREQDYIQRPFKFFDLCSGSGNITLELLDRGIPHSAITMIDSSSWGKLYKSLSDGTFDLNIFNSYFTQLPKDKKLIQPFLKTLSLEDAQIDEEYKYLLLQAGAFGGKQIWRTGSNWKNNSFRRYWEPTPTSSRRSPVNPMMPMPTELYKRVEILYKHIYGVRVIHADLTTVIMDIINEVKQKHQPYTIFYIDPPYIGTTGYGFSLDWRLLVNIIKKETGFPVYVSEANIYSEDYLELSFRNKKGGISGERKNKHKEYLNIY